MVTAKDPADAQGFELLSVEDMREKYGLVAANRSTLCLNAANVPETLRPLIPYAELWGVGDDLIGDDRIRRGPPEAMENLKRVVEA